ncbi:MAG: hypothetical protein Kow0010_15770 [Dehalococcoidia bacterium]
MSARVATARVVAFLDNEDSLAIPNIIHSTAGAAEYGYRAALVGGVTVYGWAVPAVIEVLGERWLHDGWADIFFRRPVYPGDELGIRVEGRPGGACTFAMTNQDGKACLEGELGTGRAPWFGSLQRPADVAPRPSPDPLPPLTPDTLRVGNDLVPMAVPITVEEAAAHALDHERDDHPRWRGEGALIHPSWIAGRATRLMHHGFSYGPSIHARTQMQHLAPARAGQTVTVSGRFVDAYERKGHHYAVVDVLMQGEGGDDLARFRHTTIYQVAKRA